MFIIQTYVALIAIFISNDRDFICSVLMTGRVAKLGLLIVGCVQGLRLQVSYYHLIALSKLCHLITIPEYLMAFHHLFLRHRVSTGVDRVLNLCAFLLAGTLNLFLAVAAHFVSWMDHICNDGNLRATRHRFHSPPQPSKVATAGHPYENALTSLSLLLYYFWLDGLLAVSPWVRGRNQPPEGLRSIFRISYLHSLFTAVVATTWIRCMINWLTELTDATEQQWGFGQMVAVAGIGITTVIQWTEYALGMGADQISPRYYAWYLQGSKYLSHRLTSRSTSLQQREGIQSCIWGENP